MKAWGLFVGVVLVDLVKHKLCEYSVDKRKGPQYYCRETVCQLNWVDMWADQHFFNGRHCKFKTDLGIIPLCLLKLIILPLHTCIAVDTCGILGDHFTYSKCRFFITQANFCVHVIHDLGLQVIMPNVEAAFEIVQLVAHLGCGQDSLEIENVAPHNVRLIISWLGQHWLAFQPKQSDGPKA